jgi:hypothetical protein
MCDVFGCRNAGSYLTQPPFFAAALCSYHQNQLQKYLLEDLECADLHQRYRLTETILQCAVHRGDISDAYRSQQELLALSAQLFERTQAWLTQAGDLLLRAQQLLGPAFEAYRRANLSPTSNPAAEIPTPVEQP